MKDYDILFTRNPGTPDVTLNPLSRKGLRFFEEVVDLRGRHCPTMVFSTNVAKLFNRALAAGVCFKVWQQS